MKTFLLAIILSISISSFAQNILDIAVRAEKEENAIDFFSTLEKQHRVKFCYLEDWIRFAAITTDDDGKKLKDVLDRIANAEGLAYTTLFNYEIIFTKDPSPIIAREDLIYKAAAAKKTIEVISFGNREKDYRPGKYVQVSGRVKSEVDGESLASTLIVVEDLNQSFTSDEAGNYNVNLPAGEHVLSFHAQGFADKVIDLRAYTNGILPITLEDAPTVLEEVVISDQAIVTGRAGQSAVLIKNLKRGPTFLGEADIIKNLQVQPGVTSVGEVSSGFNVRGGGTDQNLVLYDGVPIFNTSHALGFFSAFNPDAVGNVSFYRGGIPAEYGSRVSSILAITAKEGDYKKWSATGGIGIISSSLTVGGPVKRDTSSITASFRSSYSNWLLRSVQSNFAEISNSSLAFWDGSFKFAHKFSSKTKLSLSAYSSRDEFSLTTDTLYRWKNNSATLKIDHIHNERLFSTLSLGLGNYSYQLADDDPENAFRLNYGIVYPSLNLDVNYNGTHSLSFGIHNTFYSFYPGSLKPATPESSQDPITLRTENSIENAIYISDAFYPRDNLFVELGIRYSLYNRVGPSTVYVYQLGSSLEARNTIDSLIYSAGDIIKTYHGPEPRASLRYMLAPNSSIKIGYNRIYQYLHLITNTAAITPVDIWQSSNTYFKPQIADQISIGYYTSRHQNMFEGFVEAYYKNIQNILDFKDGSTLILNKKIETALLPGKAISYGVELSISKIKGRLQGLWNYTFSRSLRQVDGMRANEKINDGKFYPSNHDQPHVVNLNWRYGISRRHFFSGNFTYHTGRPMSAPRDGYIIDRNVISDFSERNKYRIPEYHRLDIAFIIEGNHKRKKLMDGTWTISFYNAYARKNAYSVFYEEEKSSGKLVPYKLSVIGTVIPSVSYAFKL